MATHSSTLALKIPWKEEPGRLQSMGSLRMGHDWATSLSLFTFMHWRRKWQPTAVFLPGESQGQRSLWAAIYGVTQSLTRLKWLSSSSSSALCISPFFALFSNYGQLRSLSTTFIISYIISKVAGISIFGLLTYIHGGKERLPDVMPWMCFRALLNGAKFCVEIFVRNPRLDFWKPLLFFICPKARKTSARHSLHQISSGGIRAYIWGWTPLFLISPKFVTSLP